MKATRFSYHASFLIVNSMINPQNALPGQPGRVGRVLRIDCLRRFDALIVPAFMSISNERS